MLVGCRYDINLFTFVFFLLANFQKHKFKNSIDDPNAIPIEGINIYSGDT